MAHASEGSTHWYDPKTGDPKYTYLNAKGERKNTTLREARKFGWVPSVSGIIRCADRPGLNRWIQDQTILACLTLPRIEGETEADYIYRLKEDSKAQAQKAAERGTLIHKWIQQGFSGEEIDPEGIDYYASARSCLVEACGLIKFQCETSFATDRYGGKCDLHSDEYLLDFKSTDKDMETIKVWDEHFLQLASYDNGIKNGKFPSGRKCGILYIHTKTLESKVIWVEEADITRGLKMFHALLDYWEAKNKI